MKRTTLAAIVLLAIAAPISAQVPPRSGEAMVVHPDAKAAIDKIKSPYCPGQMLATCPSPGAAAIRDSIQMLAEAGLSSDSIVELVLASYGQQWRAEPLPEGTGLWAWVLPPLALLGGLGLVGVILARRSREAPTQGAVDVAPEDEERLKEALRELDEEEEPVF